MREASGERGQRARAVRAARAACTGPRVTRRTRRGTARRAGRPGRRRRRQSTRTLATKSSLPAVVVASCRIHKAGLSRADTHPSEATAWILEQVSMVKEVTLVLVP